MFDVVKTDVLDRWLVGLRDRRAAARILMRLERIAMGNLGDTKAVGYGISELRIDYGPGYRVYFMRSGPVVIVLLCGGDKSSQQRDIEAARHLAREWKE